MNKPQDNHFVDLHFKSFGKGSPLVILHGLFGSLDNWQSIAKGLEEDFTIYLLDLRNHGKSPHTEDIDYPSMAQDVFMSKVRSSKTLVAARKRNETVLVICCVGVLSESAASLLAKNGFKVAHVRGGVESAEIPNSILQGKRAATPGQKQ